MPDIRPPAGIFSAFFRTPAVITPAGDAPVSAHVIWNASKAGHAFATLSVRSALLSGVGAIEDVRPRLSIRRDLVPSLPDGSHIECAAIDGGAVRTWIVDEVDRIDPEFFTAVVHS